MKTQQIGEFGWVEEIVLFDSNEEQIGVYWGLKWREDQSLIVRESINSFEEAVVELLRVYEETQPKKTTTEEEFQFGVIKTR